ncbi:primase-helicase family protein [Litoreibacter albidus]|uniref:NrS-1 polymerase-like helicase domain-containing protein n=1 Tax=Litoreibacter albidus TaxID=670155 RepID=A0A1H2V4U2_9RHOB|nr:DUF5906 domain-containing protein [Litoreibacter albidus]SDW62984.1 hypothetical protein SAMN04488001_1392 [Litoreibacter albidus]
MKNTSLNPTAVADQERNQPSSTEERRPSQTPKTNKKKEELLSPEMLAHRETLCKAVSSWFVRRENRYFDVDRWNTSLNSTDLQRICILRFEVQFPEIKLTNELLSAVFSKAIEAKHTDREQSIPVWSGSRVCKPDVQLPYVWRDGLVTLNTWTEPAYRRANPKGDGFGIWTQFLNKAIPRREDRVMFLNWLAWCLQNEADKPMWAPFFYSRRKGTGKSTLCQMVVKLFGEKNSKTLNSVDGLTSKFNLPILLSKFVVCEELQLRPDSSQGNKLKTYMTEKETAAEAKGKDLEAISQCCCFIFTSNHLPIWIEADERRYYVIDFDHSGHASGEDAEEFGELVGQLRAFMEDDGNIAMLYERLMERRFPNSFNALTLNVSQLTSPIMKKIQGASRQVTVEQLEELLAARKVFAISQEDLVGLCHSALKCNPNQVRHMMTELGWTRSNVKWGGVDYARSIWVHPDYYVNEGKVTGPDGESKKIEGEFDDIEIVGADTDTLPTLGKVQ